MTTLYNSITRLVLAFSLVVTVFSCQKILTEDDLPLNETAQKTVIEGSLTNLAGESYILLSKTATLYGQNIFDKVNNGTVTVTDEDGVQTVFIEDGSATGKYTHSSFVTTPNNTYLLQVNIDGEDYSATSSTKSPTPINYLFSVKIPNLGFSPGGGETQDNDSINILYMSYLDNSDEQNYYRFNAFTNGEKSETLDITDDQLNNGQLIDKIFFDSYSSEDTVLVELLSTDKANYTYFYSLANASDGGPFSATPANPVSNIDNGGLGYFGAYLKDTMSIIIP
jgi:hypothetical protein